MTSAKKPIMLLIMDGFGCSRIQEGNAVAQAKLQVLPRLIRTYPHAQLEASGEAVGLPAGQIGNSEVGHLNIGAGRVVYQELTRITKDIKEGAFFQKPVLVEAMRQAVCNHKALHIMGLVSPGGVHSSQAHVYALLEMAKRYGISQVYIHAFLDGRDVLPRSAGAYLAELEKKCKDIGVGEIATVSGRYYAMDRDKRWERVEKAYAAVALGEGPKAPDAQTLLQQSYAAGISDEFVVPTVLHTHPVEEGDSIIFFNFRPDRARQLSEAFTAVDFQGFSRPKKLAVYYATMTSYEEGLPAHVIYEKEELIHTLGEVLSTAGKKQLRIAETEKYAHVTYFFNGGVETPFPGEDRILVPSPKVATYDLQPEMNASVVTDKVIAAIETGTYDVIILNFANVDMVGHTGIFAAAVKAVETVDACVGRIVDAMLPIGGQILIIADHGNAEKMIDPESGSPYTAHTTNPVPCILVSGQHQSDTLENGILADVAPTLLHLTGMEQPEEMTGKNLLITT
ncbi:2,3-bisphosphoglycerate-independent phosphoglycerate mutase [Megasphaera sueciensis]|uniref:2,3-bisphosphoglycerate-independent phosphoglycerate mutase n=1 Tax=Megasphaera sueciensis TaxID=349094 RepID=UPI003D0480E3